MSTQQPQVVILTANAGGGHRTAALSLAEAFDGQAGISIVSLVDDHAPFPINLFSPGYGPSVTYTPWLWEAVYRYGASRNRVLLTERTVYPFVRQRVSRALMPLRPDVVISVHPLQIDVPLWMFRDAGKRVPFVAVVTDPVTPPVAWFCPEVDLCVVATAAARDVALQCGVPSDRVRVIGLPTRRAFRTARGRPKREARALLGLEPDKRLVLMTAGGVGIGKLLPVARAVAGRLAADGVPVQLAIIAGRNEKLEQRLHSLQWPLPVKVLGFVEQMADWLAASDLLISKAGPGTLAEAACVGVPMLITEYIPGQEAGNITWVEEHGAGVYEPNPGRMAALVSEWLRPGNPALGEMARNALTMAQPDASPMIVKAVLGLL